MVLLLHIDVLQEGDSYLGWFSWSEVCLIRQWRWSWEGGHQGRCSTFTRTT